MPLDQSPPGGGRLQRFVADLLERTGALVETAGQDVLEVMAPPELQPALGVGDFCRLGFGSAPPAGARRVGIEAEWLERFAGLIGDRGRCARLVLAPELRPPADIAGLLEQELELGNATWRLVGAAPAWTRLLILDFRYAALSDEQRDGVLRLGLNLATGAVLDGVLERLEPWIEAGGPDATPPAAAVLPADWEAGRLGAVVERALRPRLDLRLEGFIRGLRRRFARDQDRLYDYHAGLHREALARIAGLPEGEPRRLAQLRAEAIAGDYRAKLDDLGHKYAVRVSVEPVRTLDLVMPVLRIELKLRRRKGERVIALDWNPLARRLEQLPCELSHGADRARLVCDDALHTVTPAGLAPCTGCAKPYCRACHPARCPKCGRAGRTSPA